MNYKTFTLIQMLQNDIILHIFYLNHSTRN